MKRLLALLSGALLTLALTSGAFAETKTKTVTFDKTVQINGTTLKSGEYKVTYDEGAPTSQLTFQKGKEKVATATAQVKDLGKKTDSTEIVYNTQSSTPSVSEIRFGGSKQALVLSESSTATSGQ